MSAAGAAATAALARIEPLLDPKLGADLTESRLAATGTGTGAGYLDLLGAEAQAPITGPAQRLMLSGLLPVIYERWWRPGLGRIAKGLTGPSMAEEHRIARLLLALTPGDTVLDVACGPGNFTRTFSRAVGPAGLCVGIDASSTMLARALRDTPAAERDHVAYVRGDATALPFRDGAFDAVGCFAALYLFPDPFLALDEMARVLRPDGRIAILTSCRPRAGGVLAGAVLGALSGTRIFGRDEIVEALRERGFHRLRQRISGLAQIVGGRRG